LYFYFFGDSIGVESWDAIQVYQTPHFHKPINIINLENIKSCNPKVKINKCKKSHTRNFYYNIDILLVKSSKTKFIASQ
jgi:hypothetical protein